MTLLDFFTLLARLSFVILFLLTLTDLFLHRDRSRLDIALFFASLGTSLVIQGLLQAAGLAAPWLTTLGNIALLAEPFLLLRIVRYFQPVPRLVVVTALAGMLVSWLALLTAPQPIPVAITAIVLLYFVVINGYASFSFVRGAFTTAGVTRQRLRLVSIGTGLFALIIAIAGLQVVVPDLLAPISILIQFLAIVCAAAYFLGFSPPRALRRAWQFSELYRFLNETKGQRVATRAGGILHSFRISAERVVGGNAAVYLWNQAESRFALAEPAQGVLSVAEFPLDDGLIGLAWRERTPQSARVTADRGLSGARPSAHLHAESMFVVPIQSPDRPWGILIAVLRRVPLFLQDDLTLLSLLADQTALTLENASLFDTAQTLIAQLKSLNETLEQRVAERTRDLETKQEELQTSEARYRQLFDRSPQPLWVYDTETLAFLAVNEAAIAHYGYTHDDFMNMSIVQIRPVDQVPGLMENLKNQTDGLATSGPWKHIKKDGTVIDVEISSHQVELDGRAARLVLANDITARLRAQAERDQLYQELEQRVRDRTAELTAANAELEAFSYSVSHDLRAPLRHIGGYVELLQRNSAGRLDDKSTRYLKVISDAAKRMGALVDDLLAFSRIGRTEMRRSLVDLNETVAATLRELQGEVEGRDIRWEIAPLPRVHGDPAMLRQVWANLVSNAVKYTGPRSRACIEIGYREDEREHIFYVSDNGVGFDMQYVGKLFGVFQRLHSADEFDGTGIGLANVRRIIHRHHGRTWAEGQVNNGATVYFTLPRESDAADSNAIPPSEGGTA